MEEHYNPYTNERWVTLTIDSNYLAFIREVLLKKYSPTEADKIIKDFLWAVGETKIRKIKTYLELLSFEAQNAHLGFDVRE